MIQHHEGAVTTVHELFTSDGAAQDDVAFKLASDMDMGQITEIARMRRMLEVLPHASIESPIPTHSSRSRNPI